MEQADTSWHGVVQVALVYLGRYRDPMTRSLRDEIAQEAAVLAWQWIGKLQDPGRLEAAVRTIARRQRSRALRAHARRGAVRFTGLGADAGSEPVALGPTPATVRIGARSVPAAWAVQRLDVVLPRLSALDRRLLLGFHEGFCCAELAVRFGRSEACIKTRLHRARRKVQGWLEELVVGAGDLQTEEPELDR
jgi:DNA-directed RNA polymerase specialized sigma24 family protein